MFSRKILWWFQDWNSHSLNGHSFHVVWQVDKTSFLCLATLEVSMNALIHVTNDFRPGTKASGAKLVAISESTLSSDHWILLRKVSSEGKRSSSLFQRMVAAEWGGKQNFRTTPVKWNQSNPATISTALMARISKKETNLPHLFYYKN